MENNKVEISGTATADFEYLYEFSGERFCSTVLEIERLSGTKDYIPVVASERLIDAYAINGGKLHIWGSLRRRANKGADGNPIREHTYVFAERIEPSILPFSGDVEDLNVVRVAGKISKKSGIRETAKGTQIVEAVIAVKRRVKKYDYIHCLFWGRNADYVNVLDAGTTLAVGGRLQSRIFKGADGITKYFYEVSVNEMEVMDDGE